MNWYKQSLRQEKEDIIFETENSANMRFFSDKWLQSNDGDLLPLPNLLGVKEYVYISFIWIPEEGRRKGNASKIIRDFVNSANKSIYTILLNSDMTNGMVLKNLFLSLGFKIIEEGTNYIEMFKL